MAGKKTHKILGIIGIGTVDKTERTSLDCFAMHTSCCIYHSVLCISKDGVLEFVIAQKRATGIISGEEQLPCEEERMRIFCLSRRGDRIKVCKFMKALDMLHEGLLFTISHIVKLG